MWKSFSGAAKSDAAGDVLLKYASCVRNKDAEARKKAAIGLGQLAELYSKAASQRLQDALAQIGQQLAAEKDAELQTLLRAAFVRLSQEAAQRRYYRAMQQSLDSLADLEELRPAWAQSLRPRTRRREPDAGIRRRSADGGGDARRIGGRADAHPGRAPASISLCDWRAPGAAPNARTSCSWPRPWAGACARYLKEMLKSDAPAKAAVVVGLLSRLDAAGVEDLLPQRLKHGGRSFHDAVVRQLSIAGAPERGQLMANSLESFDPLVLPLALDEIGMCGDPETAPKLLRLAEGDILPQGSDYLRVKAIEALGRMRAPARLGICGDSWRIAQGFRLGCTPRKFARRRRRRCRNSIRNGSRDSCRNRAWTEGMALAPLDPMPSATWCGTAAIGESGCRATCRR